MDTKKSRPGGGKFQFGSTLYKGFQSIIPLCTDNPPAELPPRLDKHDAVALMQVLTIAGEPHLWHEAFENCYKEGYIVCHWPDGTNAAILNLKPALPTKWVVAAYKAGRSALEFRSSKLHQEAVA